MENFHTELFLIVTVSWSNFVRNINPIRFRCGRVGDRHDGVEVGGGPAVEGRGGCGGGVVTAVVVAGGGVHGGVDAGRGHLGVVFLIITFLITIRKIILVTREIMRF